jgi:CHAT domain-containing protein
VFSRQEALDIARLAPPSSRLVALDFAASKSTVLSGALAQYQILHISTHGILDQVRPELSGLVFSLVDRRGAPQDGFLRLYEIYNLKLAADLVVLSACDTFLGGNIRGEGLVGLARGFMYAGTKSVMASLWSVDDESTAELMRRFYKNLLGPKLMRPAAALRTAQVSMWQEGRWKPYNWAGFVIEGEW